MWVRSWRPMTLSEKYFDWLHTLKLAARQCNIIMHARDATCMWQYIYTYDQIKRVSTLHAAASDITKVPSQDSLTCYLIRALTYNSAVWSLLSTWKTMNVYNQLLLNPWNQASPSSKLLWKVAHASTTLLHWVRLGWLRISRLLAGRRITIRC